MVVGSIYVDLYIPGVRSLKEKRAVINKLKQRLKNQHNISIAEVSHQELRQRSALGIAVVTSRAADLERTFDAVHDTILSYYSVQITAIEKGVY